MHVLVEGFVDEAGAVIGTWTNTLLYMLHCCDLTNAGTLEIYATLPYDNNQLIHIEGAFNNEGVLVLSNPFGNGMKLAGDGFFNNTGNVVVQKE